MTEKRRRFYATTFRCPNAPWMIKQNGRRFLNFSHDELPYGYRTLDKIVGALDYVDDEVVMLSCDDDYALVRLNEIRKAYEYDFDEVKHKFFVKRRECEKLEEKNEALTKELNFLNKYYREEAEKDYKENQELRKEMDDWKNNCLTTISENSILWNEISIMMDQGVEPSDAFKEYMKNVEEKHNKLGDKNE